MASDASLACKLSNTKSRSGNSENCVFVMSDVLIGTL